MASIDFYWDVVSPYTYLLTTQLDALAERTGARIIWKPFLLGGVFKTAENASPLGSPAKARYMRADLARWRDHYNVPMRMLEEMPFPIKTMLPMRAALAAELEGGGEPFAKALFAAYWVRGEDVSQPEIVASVAAAIGMDGDSIIAATERPQIKDALRRNTDEAVTRGAFGAPTLFVGDAMFFGNDRLQLVEAYLARLS